MTKYNVYYREKMITEHKIICGDSIKELKNIPDESIDLIITDPPFNIGKKYNSFIDRKSKKDYLNWCVSWLTDWVFWGLGSHPALLRNLKK